MQCKYSLFFLFSLSSFIGSAQDFSYCRAVVSSAGASAERNNRQYDYTIGEAVIGTLTNNAGTKQLTQGFQQPDDCSTVSLSNQENTALEALIYPNPTSGFLHLQLEGSKNFTDLSYQVFDINGRAMLKGEMSVLDFAEIDCTAFAEGTYFLVFQNKTGQRLGSLAFVKQ